MVDKSDDEKHFSWCCFLLQLSLLFFLLALVPWILLCFLSSHGFSSLLITIAILVVSTSIFFLRFFKKKKRICLAERSQEEDDEDEDEDEDEDGLIEIALVSEEVETMEAMRNITQSRQRFRIDQDQDQEEEIDDVNMEEDNLIEIDISIGSIKRRL